MKRRWLLALQFGLLWLPARLAQATAAERFGFGAREAALGASSVADLGDHAAVYYDPAALTLGRGPSVAVGYQVGHYELTLDGKHYSPRGVSSFEGGWVARGSVLSLPVAVGFAFTLPGGKLSRIETLEPGQAAWLLDELSNSVAFAGLGVAVRPWPWLSLGASLGYLAAVRGDFSVTGNAVQPAFGKSEFDSSLRHAVSADLVSVRYPTFAALIEPWPALRAALVYREAALIEQRIAGRLSGDLDFTAFQVPIEYEFTSQSVAAYLPRQVTLALSAALEPATRVDLALVWQDLSQVPSPEARTSARVVVSPPPGLTLDLAPDRAAAPAHKAGLGDRIVPRLGVEHFSELKSRTRLALRAGFSYERSALEQPSAWLDATRLGASGGLGLEWNPRAVASLRLDAQAAYWHFAEERVRGDSGERHVAGGKAFCSGLSLRVDFPVVNDPY